MSNPWLQADDGGSDAKPMLSQPASSAFGEPSSSGNVFATGPRPSHQSSYSGNASPHRGEALHSVAVSGGSSDREKELEKRLAELEKREAALMLREAELGVTNNWPMFLKWTHHDINADFNNPDDKKVVKLSYYAFLFFALAMVYNMFAVVVATFGVTWPHGPTLFQLMVGLVYLIVGIPGAFILWHMKLYKNLLKNSAVGMSFAMLYLLLNVGWSVASAIAPQWSATADSIYISSAGFWCASALSGKGYSKVAIIYMVGGVLWTLEAALAAFSLRATYRRYKGRGHSNAALGLAVAGSGGTAAAAAYALA